MGKYGEAAVLAVRNCLEKDGVDPDRSWQWAAKKIFPSSENLQNKGCPKGAFLGLCSEGMVLGIPPGDYSRSEKNKRYAIDAVNVLRENRFLASQPELLWKKIVGNTKSENHQMDVVTSLWNAGLLAKEKELGSNRS